jgi:hypothetical protein
MFHESWDVSGNYLKLAPSPRVVVRGQWSNRKTIRIGLLLGSRSSAMVLRLRLRLAASQQARLP